MDGYILSSDAEQDLIGIIQYTDEVWGTSQTEFYIRQIYAAFEHLVEFPNSGVNRNEIAERLQSWRVAEHVIYYDIGEKQIEIVRVLNRLQDPILSMER